MKDSNPILNKLIPGLILSSIAIATTHYIKCVNSEIAITFSIEMKIAALLLFLALFLWLIFDIFPTCFTSYYEKRKNQKKYTDNQIKITKDILNNKIQNINDFLKYFQACPQHKPLNSSDKNTNLLILDNENDVDKLLKEFKEIINDIIKYEYIEIEIDNNIEIFTYLKYHDDSNREAVISHDMGVIFNNKFKQNRFIVKNHKKLKKLTRIRALPEQIQP